MALLGIVLLSLLAVVINSMLLPLMDFFGFPWAMRMSLITIVDIAVGWYGHEILNFISTWTNESKK